MAGRKLTALTSLGAKPELDDEFYLVDTSDTSESPQGTSKKISGTNLAKLGGFESVNNLNAIAAPTVTDDSDSGYSVGSLWGFGDNLYKCTDASVGAAVWVVYSRGNSGLSTITPVITVGTGTCTDVTVSFIRVGDRVHFEFYTRTLTIPIGEPNIALTIDLTGTGFEPSTDFSGTGDIFGIARPANVVVGANEMSSASVEADSPKKIKIDVGLTANAIGSDFSSAVTGSGSYSIL